MFTALLYMLLVLHTTEILAVFSMFKEPNFYILGSRVRVNEDDARNCFEHRMVHCSLKPKAF